MLRAIKKNYYDMLHSAALQGAFWCRVQLPQDKFQTQTEAHKTKHKSWR